MKKTKNFLQKKPQEQRDSSNGKILRVPLQEDFSFLRHFLQLRNIQ